MHDLCMIYDMHTFKFHFFFFHGPAAFSKNPSLYGSPLHQLTCLCKPNVAQYVSLSTTDLFYHIPLCKLLLKTL